MEEELRNKEAEIERLQQLLREHQQEIAKTHEQAESLIEENMRVKKENLDLKQRMKEMEDGMLKRLSDNMEVMLDAKMNERMEMFHGLGKTEAVGCKDDQEDKKKARLCSTPAEGKVAGAVGKGKKKRMKKKKGKCQLTLERSKSQDSLYSEKDSSSEDSEDKESDESEDSEADVLRSVVIREPPKIGKFNVNGTKDIMEFFEEYESYCKDKYGESKKFWLKSLGEFFAGRLAKCCETFVNVGDPKYETVKKRVIDLVTRMKAGVRYKNKNDFEEARMNKDESVDMYAYRLETLARKKYGDDGINENKELMKKFIATVPERVAARINAKRKEIRSYSGIRMKWDDVLELVEDERFDDEKSVYRVRMDESGSRSRSYSEALLSNPVRVMEEFLNEYYEREDRREEGRSMSSDRRVFVADDRGRSKSRDGWRGNGQRERSRSQGRSASVNGRNGRMNEGGASNEVKCYHVAGRGIYETNVGGL